MMSIRTGIPVSSIALAAVNRSQQEAKRLVRFKELTGTPDRSGVATGSLTTPVTDISYWEGRYVLCELRLELESGEGMTFPDAVAAVSRENRIVSTPIIGRAGTVKEYICAGDWAVNIVVGLQSQSNGEILDQWPGDELRQFRKILEAEEAVKVYSEFLDVFNIGRVVIRSYSATQMTEANYQAVEISAVSDEDYEIFSNDYQKPKTDTKL